MRLRRHYNIIPEYHPLRWRHSECDDVSNHQHHDCLHNRLFRRRSKKTLKLRVIGWEFPGDRWIPRTKGQLRGKCVHLMMSSCVKFIHNKWMLMPHSVHRLRVCKLFVLLVTAYVVDSPHNETNSGFRIVTLRTIGKKSHNLSMM